MQKCDKAPVTDKNTQKSKQEVKKEELINSASTKKKTLKENLIKWIWVEYQQGKMFPEA